MKAKNVFIHLYLALWSIYLMQGTLYSSGGLLSRSLLAILLVFSVFHFFYANIRFHLPRALKLLSIIIVIFTIYGVISLLLGQTYTIIEKGHYGVTAIDYLKKIFVSLLPIYSIFIASKNNYLEERGMQIWTIILLVIAIVGYYRFQNVSLASMKERGILREETVNNIAYTIVVFICLLPLFYKKPIIQYTLLSVCMYYVLIGMKRGALICGVAGTLWFLYNSIKNHGRENTRQKRISLILTIGIVFLVLYMVNYMLINSEYFNQRLENTLSGNSSHRDELYSTLFSHFVSETNPFRMLFGNGANATLGITMNFAHNDWLEILTNNGIVMVILYLFYWISMFKTVRHSKNNTCYMIISLFLIISFLKTFFSMSYNDLPLCGALAIGYALANYNENTVADARN